MYLYVTLCIVTYYCLSLCVHAPLCAICITMYNYVWNSMYFTHYRVLLCGILCHYVSLWITGCHQMHFYLLFLLSHLVYLVTSALVLSVRLRYEETNHERGNWSSISFSKEEEIDDCVAFLLLFVLPFLSFLSFFLSLSLSLSLSPGYPPPSMDVCIVACMPWWVDCCVVSFNLPPLPPPPPRAFYITLVVPLYHDGSISK